MRTETKHLAILAIALCAPAMTLAGSLIDPDSYRAIAADRRAFRVGDTVTVIVMETAQAESRANTGASRDFEIAGEAADTISAHDAGLALSSARDGAGETTRQGSLRAQITVRVEEVLEGDLMRVRGEQNILINGETQRIVVTGIVRREDIGPDNAVLSARLSDAEIEFTGEGVVSESQRTGLLARLFSWLGLS